MTGVGGRVVISSRGVANEKYEISGKYTSMKDSVESQHVHSWWVVSRFSGFTGPSRLSEMTLRRTVVTGTKDCLEPGFARGQTPRGPTT